MELEVLHAVVVVLMYARNKGVWEQAKNKQGVGALELFLMREEILVLKW